MPTDKRNWCAHPCHMQIHPDGTKIFTKFGPKPNHPIGSRRIQLGLLRYINKTCVAILNDPSLKLNENSLLCTKCYEKEFDRFEACQNEDDEETDDSRDPMQVKRDYAIEKLNEAFEFFQLEPVVP